MLLDAGARQWSAKMHPEVSKVSEWSATCKEEQCDSTDRGKKFLETNPAPSVDWENVEAARNLLDMGGKMMTEQIGAPESAIIEEYREITMRDGASSKIKIHRPRSPPTSGSPLVVFFFGGGWVGGDQDNGTVVARAWTRIFGATVVTAMYRLAPEHKFPVSQHDCWDTVKWLDRHAGEIGADLEQGFILSGVSAGGANAACVTAHSLEEENVGSLTHPITGQHLCVASLMDEESVPEKYKTYFVSQEQNKDALILPASSLSALQRHTNWDSQSAWRFVVKSKAPMAKFPPTYIQVCGMDTLRDDGLIYDEMLKEAGVKTKLDLYDGCPHAHFSFFPNIPPTYQTLADMVVGIGWLLGKDVTPEQGLGSFVKSS